MTRFQTRNDLFAPVLEALTERGGEAHLQLIAMDIWDRYGKELGESQLAYTWQYDYRWFASELRKQGRMMPAVDFPKGVWRLR
jgi:hypothetical protein